MSFIRSILLHLDATPVSAGRLELARTLALRHEAALYAMFAAAPPPRPVQLALSESPAALLQPVDHAALQHTKAWFDDAVMNGAPETRWLDTSCEPIDAFCRQALYADLIVLGQQDPSGAWNGCAPAGFIESVVLTTGKPCLLLPFIRQFRTVGEHVLIGWNASPQAARAVASALPWLRAARRIHVLVKASNSIRSNIDELDIGKYLSLHGIDAILHASSTPQAEAGNDLLSLAQDVEADMLVMGCYGHSRAREFVLGGATRTVLQSMTLPVLMAH